jgi:hypothetical protein
MIRERVLKSLLVVLGLLFVAGIYPLVRMQLTPSDQMLGSVYITLGVFLLLAARDPSANRSLISFTAWSSLAHGGMMAVQAFRDVIPRIDLLRAVLPLVVIGVAMILLAPPKMAELRTQKKWA